MAGNDVGVFELELKETLNGRGALVQPAHDHRVGLLDCFELCWVWCRPLGKYCDLLDGAVERSRGERRWGRSAQVLAHDVDEVHCGLAHETRAMLVLEKVYFAATNFQRSTVASGNEGVPDEAHEAERRERCALLQLEEAKRLLALDAELVRAATVRNARGETEVAWLSGGQDARIVNRLDESLALLDIETCAGLLPLGHGDAGEVKGVVVDTLDAGRETRG